MLWLGLRLTCRVIGAIVRSAERGRTALVLVFAETHHLRQYFGGLSSPAYTIFLLVQLKLSVMAFGKFANLTAALCFFCRMARDCIIGRFRPPRQVLA